MVLFTYNYTRQSGDWLPVRRRLSLRRTTIFLGKTTANWGFNYVGIFGQNVNGVMNNAFHAEEYVGQNIPDGSVSYGILPAGAFYFLCIGTGPGSKPLYIR